MTAAHLRFAIFSVIVLGLPAALMSSADPQLIDLGKLALILSPAIAGLALSKTRWRRPHNIRWIWIAYAVAVTLLVAILGLGLAIAVGAASFQPTETDPGTVASLVGGSALTSILEELGWAGGGLTLALAAFGRRLGVLILGLLWAVWHLVPVVFNVGLFSYLENASPLMIAAFVISCLVYRELLTILRERAGTWLGAAAGHIAPNILFSGAIAIGVTLPAGEGAWPFFPAPGGLVFPILVLLAVIALHRAKQQPTPTA